MGFESLQLLKRDAETRSQNAPGDDNRPTFLTVGENESFKIYFRQELTNDSKGYSDEAGLASFIDIHQNPNDYKKRAVCTRKHDEWGNKCWACQQSDPGWKFKQHVLINVAVWNAKDEVWTAHILDQKRTPAHIAETMIQYAIEYETLLDRSYKISRTGTKQKTSYSLIPIDLAPAPPEVAELPYATFDKIFKVVPPAEQEAFFLDDAPAGSSGGKAKSFL